MRGKRGEREGSVWLTWEVKFRALRAPSVEGDKLSTPIMPVEPLLDDSRNTDDGALFNLLVETTLEPTWKERGSGLVGFNTVCKLGSAPFCNNTSTSLWRPFLDAR